ncbi:hypothetical protein KFZ56_10020 [Virgibacillus sp. NKC19-3]|uniref:hypothetical protein n=1 Tax=Virgibacillus saliphilus TaxID=2831674 RepID=UPI001C9BA6F4|nr:hypothetical protein [Virgibacillus sp. NKC19-3]MBY7143379.1 hypothetical protein [Virgibacillus sp. NKC19-3]
MKRQLFFMNNHAAGFFFPYVLFVTAIVFIFITATITMYANDGKITEKHMEQIKIETLFQMAHAKFKEENETKEMGSGETYYTFPDGDVKITHTLSDEDRYEMYFKITTDQNAVYSITHTWQQDQDNKDAED